MLYVNPQICVHTRGRREFKPFCWDLLRKINRIRNCKTKDLTREKDRAEWLRKEGLGLVNHKSIESPTKNKLQARPIDSPTFYPDHLPLA
jgi:hypothetical protein